MKPKDYKALSRGISHDMSPEAIAERLRIAGELYELAQTLSTARYVGPVEPIPAEGKAQDADEPPQAREEPKA